MNINNIFQRKKHSWTLKASPCIFFLKYEDVNSFYPSGETPTPVKAPHFASVGTALCKPGSPFLYVLPCSSLQSEPQLPNKVVKLLPPGADSPLSLLEFTSFSF